MKKSILLLILPTLLFGCQEDTIFEVDFSKANVSEIVLNYNKGVVDSSKMLYECILPQKITGDLADEIVSFDMKVRGDKNITPVEQYDGTSVGTYDVSIYQGDSQAVRQLRFVRADESYIKFSGDIKFNSQFSAGSLNAEFVIQDFIAIIDKLQEIVDLAKVEIRND